MLHSREPRPQELADVEGEVNNTQRLQHSVAVMSRAKREMVKASASIDEASAEPGTTAISWTGRGDIESYPCLRSQTQQPIAEASERRGRDYLPYERARL